MKTVAIMQPYFLPYIGYLQLISAVDLFIVYDNIKYTKKGWINRNRLLQNDNDVIFSLPLKKDSDYLTVCERELAADFNRNKLLYQFKNAYRHALYFTQIFPLIEQVIAYDQSNLFEFLHHSIIKVCEYLGITTKIEISSSINIDHALKNQDKVLALCEAVSAGVYVNSIGGIDLYSKETFHDKGLTLKFIQSQPFEYSQFGQAFVPCLSIVDVMMFNSRETIQTYLSTHYALI
jgi:WbqC-like protein family